MAKQNAKNEAPETVIPEAALKTALDALFDKEDDGWEIPDEAVVGAFKSKFDQLQARVDHLTEEVLALTLKVHGKPESGRVDAVETIAPTKGSKKP